ncbi:MAG: hypothetical protein Ct9H90mP27_6390 [Gammaproteobacteria bacterium]|nr:MAG: hypothetical protein Ct9H90mP27_6390 [Gammaproteobacteria bacterium]
MAEPYIIAATRKSPGHRQTRSLSESKKKILDKASIGLLIFLCFCNIGLPKKRKN